MTKDIDVTVPNTIMNIKTKFAKLVDADNEKDRENEMASGRPVNESKHGSPHDIGWKHAYNGTGNKNPHPKNSKEHSEYEAGYKEASQNSGKDWGTGRLGGTVNEGMRDMNKRYFKRAIADRVAVKAAALEKSKDDDKKETKKSVKEQALHELSKDTLKAYRAKADKSLSKAVANNDKATVVKRLKGLKTATKKYFGDSQE